ncbi:MAG TPA: HAD family phosphatase [Gaiellaceae bacterium]|jgi:HAD superfamily hydrolase (TIGR01509 family)
MQALVFDFNGTISDDEPVLMRVYQELFEEIGRPITADEYVEQLAGHTDPEMFRRWLGVADPELMEERIRRYQAIVADGSTVDGETRAAVRYAAERGPVGLVTSAYRSEVDPVLEVTGLRAAFTAVVSLDDVTNGKPHPEPYLRVAELLSVPPADLIVFEDTDAGVESAKAAGAYVIALTRTVGAARLADADELIERIDVPLLERLCS